MRATETKSAAAADPSSVNSASPKCAGYTRRLIATLLDMALFSTICALIALPVIRAVHWSSIPVNLEEVTSVVSDPRWVSHASGALGMWIALWWCYFAVGWGLLGATPGKWACGLVIIDHEQRCPIGLSRAVMRIIAYTISSLTLGLGHLMILFRPDNRALHDILAGTRVVRRGARTCERSNV